MHSHLYTTIFNIYGKTKMAEEALGLYNMGKTLNIEFDLSAYTSLLSSFSQLNRLPEILNEMNNKGIKLNTIAYGELIRLCQPRNDLKEAKRLFNEMKVNGLKPTSTVINNLLGVYKRCGEWESLQTEADNLEKMGYELNIACHRTIMSTLANQGKIRLVEKKLLYIKEKFGIDDITWSILADAYATIGDYEKVCKI
eukprot:UN23956